MRASESAFITVRGLRYHCRIWGSPGRRTLFLLHGWMDSSASFQFLADALPPEWCLIAPDWRGYGQSDWSGADTYWFADYLADLDGVLDHFQPGTPVNLAGHSMGGNVATFYAGIRPDRVACLVNLEGFGMARSSADEAAARYGEWLAQLETPVSERDYEDFDALAARLMRSNRRLQPPQAGFLARQWGAEDTAGRVHLRVDPAHRRTTPVPFRLDEAMACWRRITARVLWVDAAESENFARHRLTPEDYVARKACFARRTEHTLADCGHMLHQDQPGKLAALIEAFFGSGD
jgi:pimeloyl-ACP methyl ester carboxylesterase